MSRLKFNHVPRAYRRTLAQTLARDAEGRFLALDDATVLAAAASDPRSFLRDFKEMTVIDEVQKAPRSSRPSNLRWTATGGYPEVVGRMNEDRRKAWYASYITTLLQRDVRDSADNVEPLLEPA